MFRTRLLPGAFLVVLTQFAIGLRGEPPSANKAKIADPTAEFVVGTPIVYRNLAVFPVSSKTAKDQDRFITLDEALKQGNVQILEKGAANAASTESTNSNQRSSRPVEDDPFGPSIQNRSGQVNDVNEVVVINNSKKPLYLMPGEIIIGGSQDRTIGQELVIAPDKKPVTIAVFCVEHGRWGERAESEYATILAETPTLNAQVGTSNANAAAQSQARSANGGKFIGSIGSLNGSGRIAVQKGDGQTKVWDEVSSANAKSGVMTKSGAFTANYAESNVVQQLRPYTEHLTQPILKTENVVGAIVAVNGKVESMDIFESTPLFKKLWPKLLKSYAFDAMNAHDEKVSRKSCTRTDALAFFQHAGRAAAKKSDTKKGITSTQLENDNILLFSAHEQRDKRTAAGSPSSAGAAGFGGGGFGGAIHSSGFAK